VPSLLDEQPPDQQPLEPQSSDQPPSIQPPWLMLRRLASLVGRSERGLRGTASWGTALCITCWLGLFHCESSPDGTVPSFSDGGLIRDGQALGREQLYAFEGFFDLLQGSDLFGADASVRSSRGTVSILSDRNAGFAVLEAACLPDQRVVVEGYWQYPTLVRTGLVRLFVEPPEVAQALCAGQITAAVQGMALSGYYGAGDDFPQKPLRLSWQRELKPWRGRFYTVAHHGACEITDHCGVTPNSVETIRLSERTGANAVEVDVRVTREQIPILFHDPTLTGALVDGLFCNGAIADSSLAELRANCSLKYGEAIPTVSEVLDAIVDDTEIEAVYLDMKVPEAVLPSARLARDAIDRVREQNVGAAPGTERPFVIVVAITKDTVLEAWHTAKATLEAEGVEVPPCLVEYDPQLVLDEGCVAWGPTWTSGPQEENVQTVRAGGAATVFWTINQMDFIDEFLELAQPNGIISSRPAMLFHRYQKIGTPPPLPGEAQ
jgi:glycerophosphoryl diester phosphodiesterase